MRIDMHIYIHTHVLSSGIPWTYVLHLLTRKTRSQLPRSHRKCQAATAVGFLLPIMELFLLRRTRVCASSPGRALTAYLGA